MAEPLDPTDPRHLTPEQRLDELAVILATGTRRPLVFRPSSLPLNPQQIRLDVSPQTSVHVPVELTQAENTEGVES